MTAIILAGGKSSRMGQDKAFIEIGQIPLINIQVKLLEKIFKKIIIVTHKPNKYKLKGLRIISDIISSRGPLSGIHSGLIASDSFYNFVIACDMPFINIGLIKYMNSLKQGFDIIVPRIKKGYEALFAIYSKNCISPIYDILHSKNFKILRLFDKVKVKEISKSQILKFGDPDILFMNINTKEDLWKIKEMEGARICQKQYQQR